MKKTITVSIILFLFVGMINAQFVEGWKKIRTGVSENIYGICCVDSCTVVACGENGKILKSTNNGDSWITTFEKEGYDLIHVDFADENVGYAWGDSSIYNGNHKGIIVKTTDGGITWQELDNTEFATLSHPEALQFSKMVVSSSSSFSIFDGEHYIWTSCDGGQTFNTHEFNFSTLFYQHPVCYSEMHFEDETGYLILGIDWNSIRVYNTANYGETWSSGNSVTCDGSFGTVPTITHFYSKHHAGVYGYYEFNYQWGSEYFDMFFIDGGLEQHYYHPLPCHPINWIDYNKAKYTSDTYGCILMGRKISDGTIKWAPFIAKNDFQSKFTYVPYGIPICDENGLNCTNLFDLDGIDTTFFIASTDGIIFKTAMVPMNGGQEWYYEITSENGDVTYQHLEYASDTTINNDRAKVIVRTNQIYDKDGHTETTHEYIKEDDNKVYWWNKEIQEFTMLYDYEAEVGDEWVIKVGQESITVHVDQVGLLEYEDESYKILSISDAGHVFDGDIIWGIGHTASFFPERLMNHHKDYDVDGLRCYWLDEVLVYHNGNEDCDAIHSSFTSTDDVNADGFRLYPNPTDGLLHVETVCTPSLPTEYRIANLLGQTLLSGSSPQIDVSTLPAGLYFITLGNQTLKFTKQ